MYVHRDLKSHSIFKVTHVTLFNIDSSFAFKVEFSSDGQIKVNSNYLKTDLKWIHFPSFYMNTLDLVNGECFRADALISGHFNDLFRKSITPADRAEMDQILLQMDSFTPRQLDEIIKKYKITSPVAKNDLSEPIPFNLMFQCQLGPEGKHVAYLRPETAQGVFINFNRLMQSANNRLPFAVAQIGHAFRNEIKPSQGVIRCREFELAEIQHFYDPKSAQFIDLSGLEKTVLPLWTSERQLNGSGVFALPLDEVIQEGVMTELVGYYLAKAFQFLLSIGIDQSKIRFREHLDHELAHYARSCWDLECLTSHGWIECGGFAQRGCYDLQCHSSARYAFTRVWTLKN